MNEEDLNNRLIEIETKLAYQEDLSQSLNDILVEQQNLIEFLKRRIEKLQADIESIGESNPFGGSAGDEVPPHY